MDDETIREIGDVINWMTNHRGLKLPYGYGAGHRPGKGRSLFNKSGWEEYEWNPPEGFKHLPEFSTPDPDASPKPTWGEILEAERYAAIEEKAGQAKNQLFFGQFARTELTDRDVLTVMGEDIHVGDGLDHMTGLLQMVEQSNIAGAHIPNVILRDSKNQSKPIRTQEKIREILDAVAERENRVESAHNATIQKYQEFAVIRDDETKTLEEREKAAQDALEFAQNYETHLTQAVEDYDPGELPTDVEELREVYEERMEATALARTKYLKGVKTQQGIDLPASCIDEENALKEVAKQHRLAAIELGRATDAAEVKTAFDNGVSAINSVDALNVPVYRIGSDKYKNGEVASVNANTVTLTAKHPDNMEEGRVRGTWIVNSGDPAKIRGTYLTFGGQARAKQLWLKLDAINAAGETFEIEYRTRNLCGPSVLHVTLEVPAA